MEFNESLVFVRDRLPTFERFFPSCPVGWLVVWLLNQPVVADIAADTLDDMFSTPATRAAFSDWVKAAGGFRP